MAPFAIFGHLPANHIEVKFSQMSRDFSQFACSDRTMIDGCNRADLRARAAVERFVGKIQLGSVDLPFLNFHLQFFANELDHGTPRDAFQNVGRDRRRRQGAITIHDEIRGRTF